LRARIGTDGSVESLQTVTGHPMLVQGAMDSVKQWTYAPYVFDGKPVPVETEVRVHFILTDKGAASVEWDTPSK
jgi:outer membrane biosynthesis protein TonB